MEDVNHFWSIDEFLDHRFDLPESGQWSELIEGQLLHLQPPDLDHGNALLNLSKALADYAESASGYPCFDLGLILQRNPDTVRFPAVSYFLHGRRFSEMDRQVTDTVPGLVIELASTHDRRQQMSERVREYLAWGVPSVWVIDPAERTIARSDAEQPDIPVIASSGDLFDGGPALDGFRASVGDFFTEPVWWS